MKQLIATHKRQTEDAIDITPMLDVVFILLIFFIVTTSFNKEKAIELHTPSNSTALSESNIPPIVVDISAANEIKVNNTSVDWRLVKSTVLRLLAQQPTSHVVVRVDPKASTKTVVRAIDGTRSAKVYDPIVTIKRNV